VNGFRSFEFLDFVALFCRKQSRCCNWAPARGPFRSERSRRCSSHELIHILLPLACGNAHFERSMEPSYSRDRRFGCSASFVINVAKAAPTLKTRGESSIFARNQRAISIWWIPWLPRSPLPVGQNPMPVVMEALAHERRSIGAGPHHKS